MSNKAKIGKNVFFEGEYRVYGSTQIGDECFIGNSVVLGHPVRANLFESLKNIDKRNPDWISGGCLVGSRCVIRSGSVVYERVKLSNNVETGHSVLIREDVEVGEGSRIGTRTILDGGVRVGSNVNIQSGVYLPPGSVVHDGVFIGPFVVITNDLYPPSPKILGVSVGEGAIIGAGSILIAGVKIGRKAVVGAGSIVTKNIPDEAFALGTPAKIVGTRDTYEAKREKYLNG
ncbi:MAG: DapH/DapD/GlmU-related protein [Thermoprotei archaeon]